MKYISTATLCSIIASICTVLYFLFPGAPTLILLFYVSIPLFSITISIGAFVAWGYLRRGYEEDSSN